MYCKKCGTEQKEGQKFCPKCGTPYIDMIEGETKSSSKNGLVEINNQQEATDKVTEKEQIQEPKIDNKTDTTQPLNPDEERKVLRMAKAGMWIILIAIVFTFIRAGFGFSFWWYLYLIILAVIAFVFWISSNSKVRESRRLDSNDSYMINLISWIGAIMLVILYLWGPLKNVPSESGNEGDSYRYEESSSSDDSDRAPSWIQGTWYCVTPYGNMQIEIVGDHIREILGDGSSYYGTYHIQGDAIMTETGSQMYYQMDFDKKRLSAGQGYYFRKQ